ncbi:MAG TPA: hypothetical protein DGM69_01945, partial [Chloroflexi bacterium]|nr:hypothetical protein [Chloroflexota bacterium]
TQIFSSSSDTTTLAVLDTSIYMANQTFAPATPGVYDMRFWASSDQLPSSASSDTSYMQAIITDTVYGRDYGNGGNSGWRVARDCGGLQLGNVFDIYVTDTLTSVSAYLQDYSVPGTNMYGVIYEVDTTTSPWGFIMWDQTSDYTIQQQDPDSWVTIMFDDPIELYPGPWMIAIGSYAHPLDTFGISTSGDAEVGMSRIQDNGCNLGSQSFGYWYWVSSTPMIRMNFGDVSSSSTSIEESKNGLVQIYPNPTQGILNITLADSREYTVKIEDLLGKAVYSDIISESNSQINISNYQKGIYLITISDGANSYTEKIIFE